MWSTCGARPSARLGVQRANAGRTPNRCCSSTTATASDGERDVVLDQRVGADDEAELAAGELAEDVGAAARGRRAREQRRGHGLARHQRLERGEVLLGERLGRRHQRGLTPVLDGAQHRLRARRRSCPSRPPPSAAAASDRSSARSASISSIARCWSPVGANGSSVSSQRRVRPGPRPSARLERQVQGAGAHGLTAVRPAAQQIELDEQQLVERQAPAPALARRRRGRRRRRRGAVGQALARAQTCRQRLGRRAGRARGARAPGRGSASRRAPRSPGSARRRRRRRHASAVGACEADAEAVARPRTCRAARAGCPAGYLR